jgi:YD repeat-containing protein
LSKPSGTICSAMLVVMFAICGAASVSAQTTNFQYFYDDIGQLAKVIDSAGNEIDYIYDPVGNLLQIKRGTAPPATALAVFAFTPTSGDVGTSVTIQGQAFSTTLGGNTVQFNGTSATVVSATATVITAVVPNVATTGPISVTVGTTTVTSSSNFTISPVPSIGSLSRKSALFNTSIPSLGVTGANLAGANFSFQTPTITIPATSIQSGNSAILGIRTGSTAGTFALVAFGTLGSSSSAITKNNRFTVVDPTSTADTDGDGIPDAVEAAYGTDPLDSTSFPTASDIIPSGEADSVVTSILNIRPPAGSASTLEADALVFSILNTSRPPGSTNTGETGSVIFSLLNIDGYPAATTVEVDSVVFSVNNSNANAAPAIRARNVKPQALVDSDGDGYPDVLEVAMGSDPNDPNSVPVVHPPPEADSTVFSVWNKALPAIAAGSRRGVSQPTSIQEQKISRSQIAIGENHAFTVDSQKLEVISQHRPNFFQRVFGAGRAPGSFFALLRHHWR